jgi:hypothetical protein
MIVLDDFALFFAPVVGNDPFAAKEQPLQEAVERFALVHGAQNRGLCRKVAYNRLFSAVYCRVVYSLFLSIVWSRKFATEPL